MRMMSHYGQHCRKKRKKNGRRQECKFILNLILFVLATLCVTVDGLHVSARPDPASLLTRPSTCMLQGYVGCASVIGVTNWAFLGNSRETRWV